jgi:hypothetical protein
MHSEPLSQNRRYLELPQIGGSATYHGENELKVVNGACSAYVGSEFVLDEDQVWLKKEGEWESIPAYRSELTEISHSLGGAAGD